MLWLQEYSKYDLIGNISHLDGILHVAKKSAISEEAIRINGFFQFFDETLVAIFAFRGDAYLKIGAQNIRLGCEVKAAHSRVNDVSKIAVRVDADQEFVLEARLETASIYKDDPTPFLDQESFDFLLFISNHNQTHPTQDVFVEVNGVP